VLHVDCLTPDFDTNIEIYGSRIALANPRQINRSIAELSRLAGELMITVSHPELRVTAGWPAGDEIPAPSPRSSFRRAIATVVR
jgi:hypothetical protein